MPTETEEDRYVPPWLARPIVDDLRLFTLEDVGERTHLGASVLRDLSRDPRCPLKFVRPRHGRSKVCSAAVLRAFLLWLISEDDVRVEP
ncbi:MAG: hypothetical protein M9894_39625 [Planctomycetes bacterium]|nr:hypothetical protein [Planctomycetota bacterium]